MNDKDYQRILNKIRTIRQKAIAGYRNNERAAKEAGSTCQVISLVSSELFRSASEISHQGKRPLSKHAA